MPANASPISWQIFSRRVRGTKRLKAHTSAPHGDASKHANTAPHGDASKHMNTALSGVLSRIPSAVGIP